MAKDTTTDSRSANQADFVFKVDGLTSELRVTAFRGSEGISQLYHFHIDLCSEDPAIAFASVVGKAAVLTINGRYGWRVVHGLVRRFERVEEGPRLSYYAVELVPPQWMLTRRVNSRIYQESYEDTMTPNGIVKKVVTASGLAEDSIKDTCNKTYPATEFVVQYRESDWDFISRTLERAGIAYFFEHADDGVKLVLADNSSAYVPCPLNATFEHKTEAGLENDASNEVIFRIRDGSEICMGSVELLDYNFTTPTTRVKGSAAGEKQTHLQLFDYPAGFGTTDDGTNVAKTRLAELVTHEHTLIMKGGIRCLVPGQKFTLKDSPRDDQNIEYLVTQIRHAGKQPQSGGEEASDAMEVGYASEIVAIPSAVLFTPPRVTPRPVVHGTHTAMVVGPSGEEIYVDKYGRIKIQFHWDRKGAYDEKSSCWVRCAQGMAGGQYGILFLPRVGQEVVVDFLEGDPDRPLVIGSVYNNSQMPAYALPDEKTKSYIKTNSSKGGGATNELRFEDKKDSEQILINAAKDLHIRVKNDYVETVKNNRHVTVEKDVFVAYKQKCHTNISLDQLSKVGGNSGTEITGDYGMKVGGKASILTTGDLYLKSGGNLVIEAATQLTLKVGGNFVTIDSGGVTVKGTMVKLNSGGSAGSGSEVSVDAPEDPIVADEVQPGADITYSASPDQMGQGTWTALTVTHDEPTEEEREPESWVEIEMVDEDGNPWANEYYEVTRADGRVIKGYLNDKGQAHIYLPKKEAANVKFPKLDGRAWEKLS